MTSIREQQEFYRAWAKRHRVILSPTLNLIVNDEKEEKRYVEHLKRTNPRNAKRYLKFVEEHSSSCKATPADRFTRRIEKLITDNVIFTLGDWVNIEVGNVIRYHLKLRRLVDIINSTGDYLKYSHLKGLEEAINYEIEQGYTAKDEFLITIRVPMMR